MWTRLKHITLKRFVFLQLNKFSWVGSTLWFTHLTSTRPSSLMSLPQDSKVYSVGAIMERPHSVTVNRFRSHNMSNTRPPTNADTHLFSFENLEAPSTIRMQDLDVTAAQALSLAFRIRVCVCVCGGGGCQCVGVCRVKVTNSHWVTCRFELFSLHAQHVIESTKGRRGIAAISC